MPKTFPLFSLKGIRGRLLMLLFVVLVPVLLIEAFVFYRWYETREAEELQANLEVARAFAKNFETLLQDIVHSQLVIGIALTSSQPLTRQDQNRILDQFQADNPVIRGVFWMNDQGFVVASSLRSYVGFNLGDRSYFQRVKEGRQWAASELIVGKAADKPGFTVSRGIRNEKGKLLGVVAATIEPDRLDSVIGIARSKEAGVSLLDNKGMHVYRHPVSDYTSDQRDWLKLYPIIGESLKGKDVTTTHRSKLTGEKRLVAFTPVSSIGWVAAASRAEDEVMKAITSTLLFQAGFVFLVTWVGFGAALALARPISNSIIGLRNYALALGRGETANPASVSGSEELKDLAGAFNQMVGEVRSREAALRESEEKYKNLVKYAPAAIYEMDLQGANFLSVNEAMCDILGYSMEELLSTKPADLMDEESRSLFKERIRKKQAGEKIDEAIEYRIRRKDGEWIDAAINVGAITYTDGKPNRVVVIGYDITERKKIEQALRQSEERYRDLVQHAPAGIYEVDFTTGHFTEVNDVMCQILGYTRDEFLAMTAFDILDDEGKARFASRIRLGRSGERPAAAEYRVRAKDGRLIWALLNITFRWHGDKIVGAAVVAHDITERKRAEMQLEEVAEKYSALFNANSDGVWIHNLNGEILEVNDAYCQMSGYSRGELTHMPISRIVAVKTPEEIADHIRRVIETDGHDRFESRHRRKDGSIFNVDVTALSLGKDRASIAVFVRDMTERKRAEAALRESEERLRLAQEAGRVGIWDFNLATEELRWTPELEAIYGLEPGTVRTYQDFATYVYPDDLKTMETKRNEAVNQQKTFEYEFRIQRPCGETAWVYCRGGATYDRAGRPTRVFGVNIDITERKRADEALREAYGELDKRVQERTSELSEAVEKLRVENIQRKQLEDILRESENQVRFFASQCLTAQETERRRVAGELHDSVAASLGAMRFRIDKVVEEMKQGHGSPESLQDLGSNVTDINNEVRRIMADLRPSILDDLGIIPAMTWFCREYQKAYSHISVESQIGVSEHEVPDFLKTPIFRISQEAMNNIAKHSKASLVNLSLQKEDDKIQLTILDNGEGFDLETVRKGLGLSTMRERAQLSGGSFNLESAIGKGTIIGVSWPLK